MRSMSTSTPNSTSLSICTPLHPPTWGFKSVASLLEISTPCKKNPKEQVFSTRLAIFKCANLVVVTVQLNWGLALVVTDGRKKSRGLRNVDAVTKPCNFLSQLLPWSTWICIAQVNLDTRCRVNLNKSISSHLHTLLCTSLINTSHQFTEVWQSKLVYGIHLWKRPLPLSFTAFGLF